MGMNMYVVGFKPADEKWKQMKAVWEACHAAGVQPPKEVFEFFDYVQPDPTGVAIDQDRLPVTKWSATGKSGFELDVSKLHPEVKVIRFYCVW